MKRSILSLVALISLGLPLAACGRGEAESGASAVDARAREALACPYQAGYSLDCPAYAEFLAALEGAGTDAALASLVEDADPRVRWLGATGLVRRGQHLQTDAALRERLVTGASAETDPAAARALGAALARSADPSAHGADGAELSPHDQALRSLAESHPLPAMRAALLAELLGYGGPRWFEFTELRAGNDEEAEVRRAALSAFMMADPGRAQEVCGLWQRHIDADPDPETSKLASRLSATWGHCTAGRAPARSAR